MSRIVVATQRILEPDGHGEVREGLDVRWSAFLRACEVTLLPVPNDTRLATGLFARVDAAGLLLTGGGDLRDFSRCQHLARYRTEEALVEQATTFGRPVLGVCRGMQFLLDRTGVPLEAVGGHTDARHRLKGSGHGGGREVGSAHRFAARDVGDEWVVEAWAGDVVEAVRHSERRWFGLMWHPEREEPFHRDDIALFRRWFGGS